MKIRVIEEVTSAKLYYNIDSRFLYEEFMKIFNREIKSGEVKVLNEEMKIEIPEITEGIVVNVYLDEPVDEFIWTWKVLFSDGGKYELWSYIRQICDDIETNYSFGNMKVLEYGNTIDVERKIVGE